MHVSSPEPRHSLDFKDGALQKIIISQQKYAKDVLLSDVPAT